MRCNIYKKLINKLGEIKVYLQHPNFTSKKFLNYLLIIIQSKLFKNSMVYGYPYQIFMEPTTLCNFKCPLCPVGNRENTNPKGKLNFKNFEKIIDEIYPYIFDLHLYNWGEPFFNNDIFDIIAYAKRKNICTYVSTNLNFFTEEMVVKVVGCGLDYLLLSIDGATQETYEKYRVGGDLFKALNNVRAIVKEKKYRHAYKPIIEWRYLLMHHNENEVEIAKAMSKKIGIDKFVVEPVRVHTSKDVFTNISQRIEEDIMWLPVNDRRYDHKNKNLKTPLGKCCQPWTFAVINWNGAVSPCCSVYNQSFSFGNAFEEGFKAVWNNRKYQSARKISSWKGVKQDTNIICSFCNRYNIKYKKVFKNEK